MRPTAIPGMYLQLEGEGQTATWASSSDVKRRHFLIEGTTLKLFGRRGKTYKGQVNLLAVTDFKPSADATAPAGAIELHVRAARTKLQTCILVPDHSADDLFLGLGNAVPSHATDAGLWRKHMGSRPMAASSESVPREYRMGKTLGTGTFGKVKLGQRSDDGALFAFKCLNRHRIVLAAQSGRLAKEIRLLRLLNHPNVIRLHEVLHTPTEILMVMEYVEGGDLLEVLNTHPRFHESEVRHIFCQICSGVSFCHSLGVAHRDLKPENVLLGKRAPGSSASYVVKVADFGLSTLMRPDEMLQTACGSPHYVAPEILNFDGGGRYDGKCTDVWSLGIILHVMLCYRLPFEAESTQLLYKKIRQGLPSLPGHLSAAAASLLRGMLEVDACHRLTLAQVGEVPSRRTMPICPFRPTPPHTDPYPRAFPPPSPAPSPPPPSPPPPHRPPSRVRRWVSMSGLTFRPSLPLCTRMTCIHRPSTPWWASRRSRTTARNSTCSPPQTSSPSALMAGQPRRPRRCGARTPSTRCPRAVSLTKRRGRLLAPPQRPADLSAAYRVPTAGLLVRRRAPRRSHRLWAALRRAMQPMCRRLC
jgi:serine/threonine protein kinase